MPKPRPQQRRNPRAPTGASRGAQREMKYLKPWWSDGGGLLHLTILLSLAGLHLDLDLDLYLLLPPPTLLWDELLLASGPTNSAYALSPLPASGVWGRADQLHPKSREPDPAAEPAGRLLREVRALGVPFIPRTRVDAWLVHSVAAGDADGAHGLLGAASAGGVGASVDDSSQAAPGHSGDPRVAASSPLAAGEEEKAPAESTAQVLDAAASQVTGELGRGRGAGGAGQEPWSVVTDPGREHIRSSATLGPWVVAVSRPLSPPPFVNPNKSLLGPWLLVFLRKWVKSSVCLQGIPFLCMMAVKASSGQWRGEGVLVIFSPTVFVQYLVYTEMFFRNLVLTRVIQKWPWPPGGHVSLKNSCSRLT